MTKATLHFIVKCLARFQPVLLQNNDPGFFCAAV